MKKMVWHQKYSVGNEQMDEQHLKLLEMINELIERDESSNFIENAVQGIVDYACYHFITEEAYMEETGYPELEIQKYQHEFFIERARKLYSLFQDSESNIDIDEVLHFLSQWWASHILESDMKYKEHALASQSITAAAN